MTIRSKRIFAVVLLAAISCTSGSLLLAKSKLKKSVAQMDESQRALHALNRLTFGPRPEDVEKVRTMGVDKWIDQQLAPDKIDDSALEARLEPFRTLRMDTRTLVQNFPPPQVLKAVADGRLSIPSDPKQRAIYEAQLDAYKNRVERRAQNDKSVTQIEDGNMAPDSTMAPDTNDRRAERREVRMSASADADGLLQKSPQDRFNAILKMPADERRIMVQGFQQEEREKLLQGMTPEQREQLQTLANPQGVITSELVQSKLLRAIYSERQLDEVMTDFWFNHFNVFVQKGADRVLTTSYERDAIRPHALGKFRDLLTATATHPAMLFYLDNFQSVGPNSIAAQRGGGRGANFANNRPQRRETFFQRIGLASKPRARNRQQQRNPNRPMGSKADPNAVPRPQRGLNENYARELMELHTLGVDGGYTQQDIIEVAKVLTGWTIKQPQQGGSFEFNDKLHEPGEKHVLSQKIKEDGEKEGKKVLELLAKHPSTAKFISRKLAMRFVSDTPPQSLIDSMAATYLKTDGDIKEVLRTLFKSPEFWAPEAYRAKVKTPLEFVVSAVRITGSDVSNAQPLAQTLQRLGMPLYGMQPPTGYSMKADAWVNSAALLNRMNFGLALASGRLRGIAVNKDRVLKDAAPPLDPDAAVAVISNSLLAGDISLQTRDTIRKQLDDPALNQRNIKDPAKARDAQLGVIAGLVLGSPEFQRR